jgi:hypothetical protein
MVNERFSDHLWSLVEFLKMKAVEIDDENAGAEDDTWHEVCYEGLPVADINIHRPKTLGGADENKYFAYPIRIDGRGRRYTDTSIGIQLF